MKTIKQTLTKKQYASLKESLQGGSNRYTPRDKHLITLGHVVARYRDEYNEEKVYVCLTLEKVKKQFLVFECDKEYSTMLSFGDNRRELQNDLSKSIPKDSLVILDKEGWEVYKGILALEEL